MSTAIPGGEMLSGALNVIAQSLLLPVMILLVIFVIFAIIELGAIIAEYTGRKKITAKDKSIIIKNIASCKTQDEICQVLNDSKLKKYDKEILTSIAKLDKELYDKQTREVLARNLLEDQEFKVEKSLEKADIVAKVGIWLWIIRYNYSNGPRTSCTRKWRYGYLNFKSNSCF